MTRLRAIVDLASVGALLLCLAVPATAEEPNSAEITVRVLLATRSGDGIDPRIQDPLKAYLNRSFGNRYSSFKHLEEYRVKADKGEIREVSLPDKTTMKLTYKGTQGNFIKLKLDINDATMSVRIRDGGLFFQGGHSLDNGMMILAISATTTGRETLIPVTPRPAPRNADAPEHLDKRRPAN